MIANYIYMRPMLAICCILCLFLFYLIQLYNSLSAMQVSHVEILEHVSSILKEHGFHPTEEDDMDTINLYYLSCFT
jgi:hypothetical protein